MLDVASQVTHGITLPSPKKTRAHIIHMFKQQMVLLWAHLNVSLNILSLFLFSLMFTQ